MSFAVIFPGQGAAQAGLGRPWVDHRAWSVVTDAEIVLDRPLARLLLDADDDELGTTRASQLAVLLHSLVVWEALRAELPAEPVAFTGHSLGQVTALVASGAVDRGEGLRFAAARADRSQESADASTGQMAALVGATIEQAEAACADIDAAWIANDNAPGQVVIAGTADGLAAAAVKAKALGVRRVLPLDVGHAFHTPLLADAASALRPVLDATTFSTPAAPIVANTDAAAHADGDCWPDLLTRHLTEPVRWRESQVTLAGLGATSFLEVGPGNILAGLARRTVPDITVIGVHTPGDVPVAVEAVATSLEIAHP